MLDALDKIEDEVTTTESNIGRVFVFYKASASVGDVFWFSTLLDNIGFKQDASLKNGQKIMAISDPIIVSRDLYGGAFSVTKIFPIMYVLTEDLYEINEE